MKKRILTIIATATMLSLAACGNTGNDTTQTKASETQEIKAESEKETTSTEAQASLTKETSLADLEEYLLEKGVLSGSRTEMAAEMIGAISGFKYADSGAEFYEFDENSEAYKKIASGEPVEIEGMAGFTMEASAVNGKYALFLSNGATEKQEIIGAVKSYK